MQNGVALVFMFSVTSSAMAMQTDQQAVDQLFAAYEKPGSPGCSLGVIRDGAFVYSKGYGLGSLELGVPLSPDSVFYMASVSKQFTAASIVLAAEQGFLSLDDDIHKYIPELPDYGQPITLREMLHHTSGFRDYLGLVQLSGRNILDVHPAAEMLDLIVRQKALNFSPGSEYLYSNTNYFLLAEVIKRTTKKPLSVFAEENIFRPLGMSHTRFYDDKDVVVAGRVPAYEPGSGGSFKVNWSTNFDGVGDGGLMSSADDLLLWDKNFYDNRLGKGTLLKEMLTRGTLKNGKQIDYALGLEISNYHGLPIVEHGGALFGYRTEILRFPEQRFSVICLCNLASANAGALSRGVADVYLKTAVPPVPATATEQTVQKATDSEAHALQGKYENPRDHSAVKFSVAENSLQVYGMKLKPVGPNRFVTPFGPTVAFETMNGKRRVKVEDGDKIMFEGNKIDELHLGERALRAYAGNYKSAELDATYKLVVDGGILTLHNGWNPPVKLDSLVPDEFTVGQLGTVVFHRDPANHISSLSVYSGRIRDVTFERTDLGSKKAK
ncbi:MAG TPA: serine hydrolase domain-containing protein [Xanthobacteraceae bacterium]|jgi:CubicO group peptidase (beta-lactamase class C family)